MAAVCAMLLRTVAASLLFSAQRMRLERFNIRRLGSSCSTSKSPGQGVKQAVASSAQLNTAAVEMLSLKQVLLCIPKGFFYFYLLFFFFFFAKRVFRSGNDLGICSLNPTGSQALSFTFKRVPKGSSAKLCLF